MNRLNYLIYILLAMFLTVACDDDDPVKTEVEEKVIDYGDVEAMVEARLLTGETVDEVDMGETVTISDISKGRPDVRQWSIVSSDGSIVVDTDNEKVQTLSFPLGDMAYDVKLMVERTSDGQTDEVTLEDYIQVNHIDVTADFIADGPGDVIAKEDGGGDFTVGRTLPIIFLNKSKGAPDEFLWEFEEGTPVTSDEDHEAVVFNRDGLFEVTLTATRSSDGSTDVITKKIRVIQEYMYVQSASVDNRTITLEYDQVIMADPTTARDDISVMVYTAAGGTITPSIESISSNDKTLTIILDQDTYHDDVVTLSYDAVSASLVAEDPAFIARTMNKTHAIEVDNMFFKGKYDGGFETFVDKATNLVDDQGGRSKYMFEVEEVNTFSGNKSGYFGTGSFGDAGSAAYADILQNVSKEYHAINVGSTYQVGVWIYVEEMAGDILNKVGIYWRYGPMSIAWWKSEAGNSYNMGQISSADTGKWIYVTGEVGTGSLSSDTGEFMFRIGDNAKFYLDNMKMYPSGSYRARP